LVVGDGKVEDYDHILQDFMKDNEFVASFLKCITKL